MTDHRIWLPFPPSVNNLFSQAMMPSRRMPGRMVTRRFPTKKYRLWREEAVVRIRAAKIPAQGEPVVIKLELIPPDSRPRDADNYAKPILDALVEARVLVDDNNRYVKAVVPYWENPAASSGVIVTIRPAKRSRRPALTPNERAELARIKRDGSRLVSPAFRTTLAVRGLLDKGYLRALPGLFEGEAPQGYALAD